MIALVLLGLVSTTLSLPSIYQFNTWKEAHGKTYEHATVELTRLAIFMDNVKFIEEYNNRVDTQMTLGLNKYADMTHDEFKSMMTGTVNQTNSNWEYILEEAATFLEPENLQVPKSVDWRTKGYVTSVKDQGFCGSCYSFSTTGSIEGQWKRKTGTLVSLSAQQIIDCSPQFGNMGCDGGLMTNSFKYVKYAGGLDTDKAYQYEGEQANCRFRSQYVGAKVVGFSNVYASERSLQSAVASVGPVSVAIDASHRSLQFYTGGIYFEPACSSQNLDHAVLAVGYGSDGTHNYWIVKNSWGPQWGESGYFRLLKDYNNHCGIASEASYPLV